MGFLRLPLSEKVPGKAWRVALLQVALTWISPWHRFAFQVWGGFLVGMEVHRSFDDRAVLIGPLEISNHSWDVMESPSPLWRHPVGELR